MSAERSPNRKDTSAEQGEPTEFNDRHGSIFTKAIPRPRITLYDLLVLFTTIGFGIAQAITSFIGTTIVSVTLQWIASIVIFLFFFILSLYKSEDPETQRMKWFFQTDYSGTKFPKNLRKPTLDALRTEPHHGKVPIITANRIFVTITVVIFGLTKATLAYGGFNTAANTIDWIFGIIISSMTYCLEMYQDSSADVWPAFFVADYEPVLVSGGSFIGFSSLFLFGMVVMALWTAFWLFALFIFWQWQPLPRNIPAFPAVLDDIHFLCCKTLVIMFTILNALVGMQLFRTFSFVLGVFLRMRLPSTFSRPRLLPRIRFSMTNVVFSRHLQQLYGRVKPYIVRALTLSISFVLAFALFVSPIGFWFPTRTLYSQLHTSLWYRLTLTVAMVGMGFLVTYFSMSPLSSADVE
ncbi:uncharacterized protein LACBIDRAFT_299961 [Laccaria bicolor S238N-H82]|uniref:Predicted protein n=1 Tax=Laccaria bicolor (strain S238N-H82 / ATCC MYA-4686) TaxID=486041 RepID=B0DFR4_LACBS|nr:uncharacterized protein LACBIDRAFT_299961 [Laccaria bicolor S238N-H82]EDR06507.1 predicted protein [Laccaria bicolor S238N-H82]|eukprot:XP_001882879.1 predicted protein [Laccaria bicolor S238N-H82]